MKFFKFFVVKILMVVGLPLCESNFDLFGDGSFVTVTCRQPSRGPSDSMIVLSSTPELLPPKINNISGPIIKPIIGNITTSEEESPSCQCSDVQLWKSSDSNDGTGDHERF